MKLRVAVLLGLIASMAIVYGPSQAEGQEALKVFWSNVCRDTKRNHEWPNAFKAQPRIATRAPFNIMVNNGWRVENMVDDHHFDSKTGELTPGGKYRVEKILLDTPIHHRTIYVHQGATPEVTAQRAQAIYQYASAMSPDGNVPPIYTTIHRPQYNDAQRVNTIRKLSLESIEAPVLPAESGVAQ